MAGFQIQDFYTVRRGGLSTGLALILTGIWLMASPFLLGYYHHGTAMLNDIIVGLITIIIAVATTMAPYSYRALEWLNSYIGFWLMAAPFVLGYLSYQYPKSGAVPMWNDLICGGIIWFLSYVKAMRDQTARGDVA
jgi:hypothetical protein